MFDEWTLDGIRDIAGGYGWEPAALAAIAEVESAGRAFDVVDGRREPLIRWEGHYFDRRLTGDARKRARSAGLASPTAGKIANPVSQAARWRLLARAVEIDAQAAYESCSWGVGQVMGAHWALLGFGSVTELVNLCRRDVAGQIDVMARYIDKAGLADDLRRRDWAAVARGYNGPGYAANRYDTKMAAAYGRWSATLAAPAKPAPRPILRLGDKGRHVADLQRLLGARGHRLIVDGDFGPRTDNAVRAYQTGARLTADGIAGPKTWAALEG